MFEPGSSAHASVRILRISCLLVLGAVVVGSVVGAVLAVLVYLPGVNAMPGAPDIAGRSPLAFGLTMGIASGAGIGFIGGLGALCGLAVIRLFSRTDAVFVLGTSIGAAAGVLLASSALLVSRDGATWGASLAATACAFFASVAGSWALALREHEHERRVLARHGGGERGSGQRMPERGVRSAAPTRHRWS